MELRWKAPGRSASTCSGQPRKVPIRDHGERSKWEGVGREKATGPFLLRAVTARARPTPTGRHSSASGCRRGWAPAAAAVVRALPTRGAEAARHAAADADPDGGPARVAPVVGPRRRGELMTRLNAGRIARAVSGTPARLRWTPEDCRGLQGLDIGTWQRIDGGNLRTSGATAVSS